ncbi:MAG: serine/threonine protein kinase, partial [Myxococcales bacterium]|nr:serine/threonine protein kinase [Myxococcales bacterium]
MAGTLDASLPDHRASTQSDTGQGFPVTGWERYQFIATLGHGGMGSVYRARDPRLGREVALKFIRGGDPRLTMRLLREARAQARIEHDNVCKVFEVGEVEGKAYIAMQLVEGRSLRDVASDMSLHEKVAALRDVALALHEAHKLGILHRDIKPAN